MRGANLKSLAAHLGLTEGTVSRALNGYSDISEKTRQRIREAADELGYRPNTNARRLATGNAECIGYVLPWQAGHISEPFLGELLDGLSAAVADRNWDLNLAVARSAKEEMAIINRLSQSGRVNGLVVSRTLTHDPRIEQMRRLGVPFVTHGRTAESENHAWFDMDNHAAFEEIVWHLADLGHRSIAHIHGPLEYHFATSRLAGHRKGLLDKNMDVDPQYEVRSEMNEAGGHRAMLGLLNLDRPPTAVSCVSDVVALGAMKAIRDIGLMPGRDISVMGYDGLPIGEHTTPALSTMAQPLQFAGKRIGEMLLAVIDGGDPRENQELWHATLTSRGTDRPPRSADSELD